MTMTEHDSTALVALAGLIDREGWAPTVRELGAVLGIRSSQPVHRRLVRLTEQGWIERGPGSRQIRLTLAGKVEAARLTSSAIAAGRDTL